MLKNHLHIALRNFRRQKFYTGINIIGLAIGLSSSLLIGWYVTDELSYDQFHHEVDQVYRITTGGSDEAYRLATTPPPLYNVVKSEIPEVEAVARAFSWNHSTMRLTEEDDPGQQTVFRETSIYIVDPEFLEVLDFNIIAGDAASALSKPGSIVLTKETAERYFGQQAVAQRQVVGKEIVFGGSRSIRRVTAIVNPTGPTHFPFDMLVDTQGYEEIMGGNGWSWNIMYTYVKVKPEVQADAARLAAFREKIDRIAERHARPALEASSFGPEGSYVPRYTLQAVTDIHLHSDLEREHQANGSATTVYMLVLVGLSIILLACINFMNLSTAQAFRRAREVGVRKVMGSSRTSLAIQFLTESTVLSLAATLLALGTVEVLRIPFNALVGKQLSFDWLSHPHLLLWTGGGTIAVGLLAGSYPAFYLSSFRPATVLRGKLSRSGGLGGFQNTLITFQFAVSMILLITTAIVIRQLMFVQSQDIGYDREHVMVINNDREIKDRWKDFKGSAPSAISGRGSEFCHRCAFSRNARRVMRGIQVEGSAGSRGMRWLLVDQDYLSTLRLTMATGRNFREDIASDSTNGLIINEAAARVLALEQPVGKTIIKDPGESNEERLQIIGVVKDFNVASFNSQVKPMVFRYYTPSFLTDYIVVRFAAGAVPDGVQQVSDLWRQFEPSNPLVYSFLDQDFDQLFRSEQRLARVLSTFALLAVLVACIGLFGLASLTTAQRTKEIGVRKVLGASVSQIVYLLSRHFLRLVILAFVVAAPVAYWIAEQWLQNFAYHIPVELSVFGLAGGICVLVAWATVSARSLQAARANPVDSLRNE